jgi:hypothetical protein
MEDMGLLKPGEQKTLLKDFDKPAGQRCPYQKHHKGCALYARRPMGCRLWSCQWLVNDDTAALRRPDRSHYVIDMVPDFIRAVDEGQEFSLPVVQIWIDPHFPDAFKDRGLEPFMRKRFAEGVGILCRIGRERGIFIVGPPLHDEWRVMETLEDEKEHTAEEKVKAIGQFAFTLSEGQPK